MEVARRANPQEGLLYSNAMLTPREWVGGLRERMKVYRETVDNNMQNENDNKIRVKGAALVTCLQEGSHDSVA